MATPISSSTQASALSAILARPSRLADQQLIDKHETLADTVDISSAGRRLAQLDQTPGIRSELVNEIRAQIAAGQYDTDERVDAAADRLMAEVFW